MPCSGQAQLDAIARLVPLIRPDHGPVLDIGAGSGLNIETVLETLPTARVCALEPSHAMRSLAMMRIAAHPEWFERVTLRPESFQSARLPDTSIPRAGRRQCATPPTPDPGTRART